MLVITPEMLPIEPGRHIASGLGGLTPALLQAGETGAAKIQAMRDFLIGNAGPQRILAFPDLDPVRAPFGMFKLEWDAAQRNEFEQARDAVVSAINAISPVSLAETRTFLRGQNAFPDLNPPFVPIDTLIGQINNLLAAFDEHVLEREPAPKASIGWIIGGITAGVAVLGALAYFMKDRG
jgi:hypothetical protein